MMDQTQVALADPAALAERIVQRVAPGCRFILGVTGPPGTGKSTFVTALGQALLPLTSVIVPMDGFHLANEVLRANDLADCKGAIHTFDSAGYALLLDRLRRRDEVVVYAPSYDRAIGEPVAAAVMVPRATQIILTEGNYLLSDRPDWRRARALMDEVWYLETPEALRTERLVDRHVIFGRSPEAAARWVSGTDERNARLVAESRARADLIIASVTRDPSGQQK